MRTQRGSALLIVLFLGLFCAWLATLSIEGARSEAQRSRRDLLRLRGEAAMDGAALYAAYEMARSRRNTTVLPFTVSLNGSPVQVTQAPTMQRIDLNLAGFSQLERLFRDAGVDPETAAVLAAQVLDWRDSDDLVQSFVSSAISVETDGSARNGYFASKHELLMVPRITEEIYAQLDQKVTVFGGADPRAGAAYLLPGARVTLNAFIDDGTENPNTAGKLFVFRGSGDPVDPVAELGVGTEK